MTDLRERCIEAGADVLAGLYWDALGGSTEAQFARDAGDVLDAVLGVLIEHADEWERAVPSFSAATQVYGEATRRLLAALGGDQ